jgi:haloacid dehalogenase superfamily, subfamily IA, variant 1 with third motif having Dx(3-4)D or Dx(3-4)E
MFKLERIRKENLFDTIIVAGDVGIAKLHINIFKIACEKANVDVKESIYISDDFEVDIVSCRKAGMEGIWLNRNNEQFVHLETRMIYNLIILGSIL